MIELDKSLIRKIFSESNHQIDYYLDLLSVAFGVDDINSVDVIGKPRISYNTYMFIYQEAINFDLVVHPHMMAGAMWQTGIFEVNDQSPDWVIDMSNCIVLNKHEGEKLNVAS